MRHRAVIVATFDLSFDDKAKWRAWQLSRSDLVSPFFHWAFTQAVGEVGHGTAVAKLYRDDALVGFFPFQRRGRTAYPIGAPLNDYHGIIGAPDLELSIDQLCELIGASRLSANSWVGKGADRGIALTTLQAEVSGGYADWFAAQSQAFNKFFKDKARARRGLEAAFGPMTVRTGLRDAALLDRLIGLKREQYRRTGRHDIFNPEWTRDLLHRLLQANGECRASLCALYGGETLLALELSLHADHVWHFWFPAYLEEGARFSPGIWLSLETMRVVAEDGYRVFDYGFSGEAYKRYLCNREQQVQEITQGPTPVVNAAACALRRPELGLSLRRRWSAIEAVEPSRLGQATGIILAAGGLMDRLRGRASGK